MEEDSMEQDENRGLFSLLRDKFRGEKDEEEDIPHYKRRLFDGRIEKYLDRNLDAYIKEYGIVTGLDIEVCEERYGRLTKRISQMTEYLADADVKVTVLENDLEKIKKELPVKK
jgi:hypothetical protein